MDDPRTKGTMTAMDTMKPSTQDLFVCIVSFVVIVTSLVTATGSCYSDITNGCSNASATQRRKRAASAPSITRWS